MQMPTWKSTAPATVPASNHVTASSIDRGRVLLGPLSFLLEGSSVEWVYKVFLNPHWRES
jgi:hypothetical protein